MSEHDDGEPATTTAQEEKELKRVFELLCNYHAKQTVRRDLEPKLERVAALRALLDDDAAGGDEAAIAAEVRELDDEVMNMQDTLRKHAEQSDRKIRGADLAEAMRSLGKRCTRREIHDMIWEVDENLDGCVDWKEFLLMFQRNIGDRSGLEPSTLFNLAQFLIFDSNQNGQVRCAARAALRRRRCVALSPPCPPDPDRPLAPSPPHR